MKTENWVILLSAMIIAFFAVFMFHSELVDKQTKENRVMEDHLIESCKSALSKTSMESPVFTSEKDREDAIQMFFEQFCKGEDLKGYTYEQAYYYVPCVVLVDVDGYYVNYTTTYQNENGINLYTRITTGLNTWSRMYGSYTVRYKLADEVEVTLPVNDTLNGEIFKGNYAEVYEAMGRPAMLDFLADEEQFHDEQRSVIADITSKQINYYIETHNTTYNRKDYSYTFTMPATADDIKTRLMDEPSIIAFAQGIQYKTTKGHINVYAFTGSIKDQMKLYCEKEVGGILYYHARDCIHLSGETGLEETTMETCAKDGAYPCPDCIK